MFSGGSPGGCARCRGVHQLLEVLRRREHPLVGGPPDQFRGTLGEDALPTALPARGEYATESV